MHLDVKPSNIVMGGPPRLIDLSVARTLAEAAALRAPIGTDAYMAPEQCEPDGRLGPPADVFGLAATLYTGLTGTRPFPPCETRWPQLTATPAPLPRRTPPALAARPAGRPGPRPGARPTARDVRHGARTARRRAAAPDDPRPEMKPGRRVPPA